MSEQHRHDERLSRLEAIVEGLTASVTHVAKDVRELAASVQAAMERMGESRKLNWGWLCAGVLAAVTLITFLVDSKLAPTATAATRNGADIADMQQRELTEAYSRGRRDARLDQHDRDIDEIKKALGLRGMP